MAAAATATVVKSTPASVGKTKVSAVDVDSMTKATVATNATTVALRTQKIEKNTLAEAKTVATVKTTVAAEVVKHGTGASAVVALKTAAETTVLVRATESVGAGIVSAAVANINKTSAPATVKTTTISIK